MKDPRAGDGSQADVRINIGAGHQSHPGWVGYDRSRLASFTRRRTTRSLLQLLARNGSARANNALKWPPETRIHDVTKGLPYSDATVDCIYSSHMIEHLTPDDALDLLRECYRVLRPRAGMRVVVPDVGAIVSAYVRRETEFFPLEPRWAADGLASAFYPTAPPRGLLAAIIYRVMRADDGGHRWMYDEESLAGRLASVGFVEIERVAAGEGRLTEAAELDHRSAHHIHMEAFKP